MEEETKVGDPSPNNCDARIASDQITVSLTEKIEVEEEAKIPWYKTLTLKLYFTYFDCFMFLFDILSDWYLLLFVYLWDRDYIKAGLTFSILLYSAILVGYINRDIVKQVDRFYKIIPLLLFNFTPLVHEHKKITKIREGIKNNDRKLRDKDSCFKLAATYRFAEVFTEALPQLVLQLSIVYYSFAFEEQVPHSDLYVQFISMHTSVFEALMTIFKSSEDIHGYVACLPLMSRIYFIAVAIVLYPQLMIGAIFVHMACTALLFWFYWSHKKGTIDSLVLGLICAFDPTILHRFSFLIDTIIIVEDITMAYLIIHNYYEMNVTLAAIVFCTFLRIFILTINMKTYKLAVEILKQINFL